MHTMETAKIVNQYNNNGLLSISEHCKQWVFSICKLNIANTRLRGYLCRKLVYICTFVCMYVCIYACMHACTYVYMYVCMHACMHACMHVCMYVRTYACMSSGGSRGVMRVATPRWNPFFLFFSIQLQLNLPPNPHSQCVYMYVGLYGWMDGGLT